MKCRKTWENTLSKALILVMIFSLINITPLLSQNQRITLNLKDSPISDVFKKIKSETNLSVFYNVDDIASDKMINYDAKNKPLSEVLDYVLSEIGQNLSYVIQDEHIVISSNTAKTVSTKSTQQARTINGLVADSQGEPVIGATVVLKNNPTVGTATDIDGKYTLSNIPDNSTLVVSYVGMTSQEVVVKAGKNSYNITLADDSELLDELVVTALGIKRSEKALSYNVQQVSAEELTRVKDANFINSLNGKVAGVNINASSSGVGGATRVVMRGTKSISANNNALYVIDGVPIFNANDGTTEGIYSQQPRGEGISDINPEDIESMSVLSGPAAAALYGSNAAQGVILITTKKGTQGKVKVTVSNNTTFSRPFVMPEFQNTYANRAGEFKSWGQAGLATDYDPSGFFNTGTNIQNAVTLSVGNERNQTFLSLGSTNANGMIVDNSYNRYNFTFRNTTNFLNDRMTLDVGLSYIIQNDENMMAQGEYYNPLVATYLFPRGEDFSKVQLFEEFDEGRQIYTQRWDWGSQGLSMQNPYWIAKRNTYGTKKDRYMMNASLSYELLDWLSLSGRIRLDHANSDLYRKNYASTSELFASPKGFYAFSKMNDKQVYGDLMANINKNFDNFSLSANIGTSITDISSDRAGFQGALKDMPNLFNYYNIDFKNGRDSYPIQSGWHEQTQSIFASGELGWRSMLYLTLTGRSDWPSALANTERKSFPYPSVGLSGVVTEMVELPKVINYLKVRGSWAKVGSAIPRGLSQPRYEWDPATGKWATNTFRPLGKLFPEMTESWEAGVAAKFFNNKLSLDATWYKSNTKNQTFNIPVSASSGYSSMYVQSGNVQNYGAEVSLGYNQKWNEFSWSSNLTFSFNENKVIELLDNYEDPITGEFYSLEQSRQGGIGASEIILTKGGTMGDLYIKKGLKRDQEGNIWIDPTTNNVVMEQLSTPKKVGSVLPKGHLAFRNDFNWKGLNVGFILSSRLGGVVISHTQAVLDEYGVSKNSAIARDNGGISFNNGSIDAEKYYSVAGGRDGNLLNYVYDATNVRLQEVSLGYGLPSKWFDNKMNVSLSLVGRNLLMIYSKAPFDPEMTASTGTYFQGMDYFMQPSQSNYGFNVKVQF